MYCAVFSPADVILVGWLVQRLKVGVAAVVVVAAAAIVAAVSGVGVLVAVCLSSGAAVCTSESHLTHHLQFCGNGHTGDS